MGAYKTQSAKMHVKEVAVPLTWDLGYCCNVAHKTYVHHLKLFLRKCEVFYIYAHGVTADRDPRNPFRGFNVGRLLQWGEGPTTIGPQQIRKWNGGNKYRLVFINGCKSADLHDGSATEEFIEYFHAESYLGWTKVTDVGRAGAVAPRFFRFANATPEHPRINMRYALELAVASNPGYYVELQFVEGGYKCLDLTPPSSP